jgi:glycosyltransferase involved in cell wall biosynthesis
MSTVLVDLSRLRHPHCGLGQHALHVGRNLQSVCDGTVDLKLLAPRSAADLVRVPESRAEHVPTRLWQKGQCHRWLRAARLESFATPQCDVWHRIDHLSAYAPVDDGTPVVLTIHDLNFPAERSAAHTARSVRKLQRRVDRAAMITTISQFAAGQIRERLNLRGKEVRVVYLGTCVRPPTDLPRPRFAPHAPYLFSIGEFRPSKNFHVLIEFLRRLPDLQLVIAGNTATPYGRQVREQIESSGLASRIHLPGIVTDDERQWLYQNCESLVFPSQAEGFGLPAIEAMSLGKPTILAHATSLPEIGGELAHYWTNFDPEHMAEVWQKCQAAAAEPGYGDRLRSHAAQFTWANTARAYLRLYGEVLGDVRAAVARAA